jgi:hypothetical protein
MILPLPERTSIMATKKQAPSSARGFRVGPPPATLDDVVEAVNDLDKYQDQRHQDVVAMLTSITELLREIAVSLSEAE